MELEKGIYHILDGNAIVIMGAGASYGAQNSSGRFPIGTDLARELYKGKRSIFIRIIINSTL